MGLRSPVVGYMVEHLLRTLIDNGAANYAGWGGTHPEAGPIELSIQRKNGETPSDHLRKATERLKRATDLLAKLLPYAHSHAEDWCSGLEDGTYKDRAGWERLNAAVDQADALLAELGMTRIPLNTPEKPDAPAA